MDAKEIFRGFYDMKKTLDPSATYLRDECNLCGECLAACPYMKYDRAKAGEQIRLMRDGLDSPALEKCAGCATCDTVCPRGCRPYSLIRARWNERYISDGIPEYAEFLMPFSRPNFRTAIAMTQAEKSFLKKLEHIPYGGVALYAGCNTLMLSQQLKSKIFKDVDVFGSIDWCCGEMYYRAGLFDYARQSGMRLKSLLAGVKIEKMLFVCAACYNMFSNIFPNEFGIKFGFEMEFYTSWLADRLDRGLHSVPKSMSGSVVMHDPCHAKWIEAPIREDARRIVASLGGRVIEPAHTRDESLCCGVAAGCARYNPADMFAAAARRLIELDMARADKSMTYCNGCFLTMLTVKQIVPSLTPMVPLLEAAQTALGERARPHVKNRRARQMLAAIAVNSLPKMLGPRRNVKLPGIGPLEGIPPVVE